MRNAVDRAVGDEPAGQEHDAPEQKPKTPQELFHAARGSPRPLLYSVFTVGSGPDKIVHGGENQGLGMTDVRGRAGSVLVVDDDPTFLSTFRRELERRDWRVATADCVADATEVARTHRPSVVVLDLMLGDGCGSISSSRYAASRRRRAS